jgi:hypothetical protein
MRAGRPRRSCSAPSVAGSALRPRPPPAAFGSRPPREGEVMRTCRIALAILAARVFEIDEGDAGRRGTFRSFRQPVPRRPAAENLAAPADFTSRFVSALLSERLSSASTMLFGDPPPAPHPEEQPQGCVSKDAAPTRRVPPQRPPARPARSGRGADSGDSPSPKGDREKPASKQPPESCSTGRMPRDRLPSANQTR